MTTDLKAGKECLRCEGSGMLHWKQTNTERNCVVCDGLGWLPQPGDALTWEEARILEEKRRGSTQYRWQDGIGGWENTSGCKADWVAIPEGMQFRLAPAQEQPALTSKLPASFDACDWAQEFGAITEKLYKTKLDQDWLVTWFSNALMAGYDEKSRQLQSQEQPAEKVEEMMRLAWNAATHQDLTPELWAHAVKIGNAAPAVVRFRLEIKRGVASLTPAQLEALRKERA